MIRRASEFELSDSEFARIRKRVYREAGISLSEEKRTLVVVRLAKILRSRGNDSFDEYLDDLERGSVPEAQEFINALTTNLTRFWREAHHFDHLVEYVGGIVRTRGGGNMPRRLRIWSAGCSTGQEPYSIALSLLNAYPELKRWDFRILATDIDTNVIARAAAGSYSDSELNELPIERARLFERSENGHIRVPTEAKRIVSFKPLNLLGEWPMKGKFDAIFCRNVAIYFDKPTQAAVFTRLAAALQPGGMLYVGHSENLGLVSSGFRLVGKTVYQARETQLARSTA
ncbi:MAG: protein-glutamate O-methyltransferase CheR [Devosia sp.]